MKTKRSIQIIFGILVSLILLYLTFFKPDFNSNTSGQGLVNLLFSNPRVKPQDFVWIWNNFSLVFFIYAVSTFILELFVRALRWKKILQPLGNVPYPEMLHSTNLSYFLNCIFPLHGGELIKAITIGRRTKIKVTSVFMTVIVERIFDALSVSVSFMIAVVYIPLPLKIKVIGISISLTVIGSFIFIILLSRWMLNLYSRLENRDQTKPGFFNKFLNGITQVIKAFSIFRQKRELFQIILLSFTMSFLYILTLQFMLQSFGFTDGTYPHLGSSLKSGHIVSLISIVGLAIPSAPGSVGTYDYTLVYGLEHLGIPTSQGIPFTAFYHWIMVIIWTVLGLYGMLQLKLKWNRVVKSSRESESIDYKLE